MGGFESQTAVTCFLKFHSMNTKVYYNDSTTINNRNNTTDKTNSKCHLHGERVETENHIRKSKCSNLSQKEYKKMMYSRVGTRVIYIMYNGLVSDHVNIQYKHDSETKYKTI